jgi:PucR C-terminal helix-turn-helix domain/GGDEF-like domain
MRVDEAVETLADALLERIPRSVEDGLELMRAEVPCYFTIADDDPAFVDLYIRSYTDHLTAIWTGLKRGPDAATMAPPPFAVGEATWAAQLGISLESLLQTFRVCHRQKLDEVMEEAEARIPDTDVRSAAIRRAHRWLFTYFDWITPVVTEAYQRERDAQFRGRERRKRQFVRRLLDGDAVDERELGYRIEQEHIGIVAWGAHAEQALSALAHATGGSVLVTTGSDNAAWGWIGARAIQLRGTETIADLLPSDTYVALGAPGEGLDGFRATHRQALEARRVGRLLEARVTRFEEVEFVALTTQNLQMARDFVDRQLGPLAADDERSALLRETLRAYFDAGLNAAAACAPLKVNDRTVAYRIRNIEDRLGGPILGRQDELSLALRLLDVVHLRRNP